MECHLVHEACLHICISHNIFLEYRKPAGPSFYPGVINLGYVGPVENQVPPKFANTYWSANT